MSADWWYLLDTQNMTDTAALHARAKRLLGRLTELDLGAAPGSRFTWATAVLGELARPGIVPDKEDPQSVALVLEAIRCTHEMYVGLFGSTTSPSAIMRERIKVALGGPDLPNPPDLDNAARNAQFEVYIYGLLSMGGFEVRWCEPDLAFQFRGRDVGVAVKRVWGQEQARKRMSEAVGQLDKAGLQGIIATNAETYLSPLTPGRDTVSHQASWRDCIARLLGHRRYLAEKANVMGHLLCATYTDFIERPRCVTFTDIHAIEGNAVAPLLATYWRDVFPTYATEWHRADRALIESLPG